MTTRTSTGVDVRFHDRWTLRYERTYPHPIERVFRAVSEPDHLHQWLPNDAVSGAIVAREDGPHVFELAFPGEPPARLRFELTAADDHTTTVVLLHQCGPLPDSDRPAFTTAAAAGWERLLAFELPNHLDGQAPPGAEDLDAETDYERLLADDVPPPPAHSALATFDTRHRMRHVRTYDHPIERVWEAVTDPEQMEAWLLPHITVEPRLGGRATFTWGGPADEPIEQTILEWEPPRLVDYGGIRFELEALTPDRTQLTFVHWFDPDFRQTQPAPVDDPGGDLPGGPDTPWRPGFVAGFHLMLDALTDLLADPNGYDGQADWIDGEVPNALRVYAPEWVWLCHVYRHHIAATIPPPA